MRFFHFSYISTSSPVLASGRSFLSLYVFIKIKLKIIISHIPSQFSLPPQINVRKMLTHFQYFQVQKSIWFVQERFLSHWAHRVFSGLFWVQWKVNFTAWVWCNNLGSPSPRLQAYFFCEHCEIWWRFRLVNDEKYNYFPWASWRIKRRDYVRSYYLFKFTNFSQSLEATNGWSSWSIRFAWDRVIFSKNFLISSISNAEFSETFCKSFSDFSKSSVIVWSASRNSSRDTKISSLKIFSTWWERSLWFTSISSSFFLEKIVFSSKFSILFVKIENLKLSTKNAKDKARVAYANIKK